VRKEEDKSRGKICECFDLIEVLAWLMASKGWTFEVAEEFLHRKCSSVGILFSFYFILFLIINYFVI
jgi:hypothetical protein